MERVFPAARQGDGRGEGEVVEADRAGLAPLQRKDGVGLDGGRALDAVAHARRARVEARGEALGARRRLHTVSIDSRLPGCPCAARLPRGCVYDNELALVTMPGCPCGAAASPAARVQRKNVL